MTSLIFFNFVFDELQTLRNILNFKALKARYGHTIKLSIFLFVIHINGMI